MEDKPQAEAHKHTMVHGYIEILSTAVKCEVGSGLL